MSKTWKWILGIVIVLVVVALIATPFILRSTLGMAASPGNFPRSRAWDGPFAGRGFDNWNRHPMMFAAPFGGLFMGVGMLLSLIVPAGILFAVIYGAVRLAFKNSLPLPPPLPAAPVTQPCPKCGYPIQLGWKHCPQCGAKQ